MANPKDTLGHILFLDIETVPAEGTYGVLPERTKNLWNQKAKSLYEEYATPEESYEKRAAIYAEFGKIIVIGLGFFHTDGQGILRFKTKVIYNHHENELLAEFADLLQQKFSGQHHRLCAHNGKEFDFPYICRRLVVHRIPIPKILQLQNLKPWEVPHLDTLEMWKFGDRKSFTSLDLLAALFQIESSKEGIDGSLVHQYYYQKNDLKAIADYCKRDVIVLARIYLRLAGLEDICPDQIIDSN